MPLTAQQVEQAFTAAAIEGRISQSIDWQRIADLLNQRLAAAARPALGGKHCRPEPVE